MAGVGIRRWAQALAKGRRSGVSALLAGCRAGQYCVVFVFAVVDGNLLCECIWKLEVCTLNLDMLTLAFAGGTATAGLNSGADRRKNVADINGS